MVAGVRVLVFVLARVIGQVAPAQHVRLILCPTSERDRSFLLSLVQHGVHLHVPATVIVPLAMFAIASIVTVVPDVRQVMLPASPTHQECFSL